MSGKGAKERRIAKRRQEKRYGLTDRAYKVYREKRRSGYGHDAAMTAAENYEYVRLPAWQRKHKDKKISSNYSPLLGK